MKRMIAMVFGGLLLGGGLAGAQQPGGTAGQTGAPAASCPCGMMGKGARAGGACGQMRSQANVRVEKTANGAVIRMTAKSPQQVAAVQQHAEMMSTCMGGTPAQ